MTITFHTLRLGAVRVWMPDCCDKRDIVEKARELGALCYTLEDSHVYLDSGDGWVPGGRNAHVPADRERVG